LSERVRLARISSEPLSIERCVSAVSEPAVGGIGVFVGTVRDHDHGREVTALTYEAHPSATQVLLDICEKIADDDVAAIAVEHRVGQLSVGDRSVVVAVGAAHRAEALDKAHELIDAIKANVPIWKQQTFADGTSEWVNCP
jgi:molybdopterin synthase catalytic subunit